jgi:serine/threonine protein kinase
MSLVVPIGDPVNDAERAAIGLLRDRGPASWTVFHNFEIVSSGESFEVDLAVVAPHAVFLIDVKGTRGLIEVDRSRWYPEGRAPFPSPLAKLRNHARTLKGLLTSSNPGRLELQDVFVAPLVLLTAPDAVLRDPDDRDSREVTTLDRCIGYLSDVSRVPTRFSRNITSAHGIIRSLIQGKATRRNGPLQFGNWVVTERLGGTDQCTEYRARNAFAGGHAGTVILKVYRGDPYVPAAERSAQRARISNAYQALSRLPAHPGIAGARDFFPTEGDERFVLVTEDIPGQALRLHLSRPTLALTLDQKIGVARGILGALAHTHAYQVVHRALNPATVLVGKDGRVSLTGFDYARAGTERSHTIAGEALEDLEAAYLAPECQGNLQAASPASDVFSVGLILYELFVGAPPFASPTDLCQRRAVFPVRLTSTGPELPKGLEAWLQSLCAFDPLQRPTAEAAASALNELLVTPKHAVDDAQPAPAQLGDAVDFQNLAQGFTLTRKYVVQSRLGTPGAFGVVYKVFDCLADVTRALKLILRDRTSTVERLKREYGTLRQLPPHENVVKVIDADFLPGDGPPFLVFEYVDGLDVGEMIDGRLFTPPDGLRLAREVAEGIHHLHKHGVYHCDIKPRNLIWTDHGTKLIDFNVSVVAAQELSHGGGSRRYLPPDLDLSGIPTEGELADRDLYAFGITLYEVITGRFPWDTPVPPPACLARDPRELSGLSDLSPDLADILLKATAPLRADRFSSASDLMDALAKVAEARSSAAVTSSSTLSSLVPVQVVGDETALRPNTNPFVSHLLTLYSQSRRSNRGTRGLDRLGEQTYVETALDRDLVPAVLAGEFCLVVITGNAGDGKTALLQQLESRAREEQAHFDNSLPNGSRFTIRGRRFTSNYDGSQDEGDQANEAVLDTFFESFAGSDEKEWPKNETRLIAINEGRLVDFLESKQAKYPRLMAIVRAGLQRGRPEGGVAVVDLNLRSVVADQSGFDGSILERQIRRFCHEQFWAPCQECDLRAKCYAYHNALTFQDSASGPRVIGRMKTLFTLTHLRGRQHMTLRDLRSALAFQLTGNRDCDQIHELYAQGRTEEIAASFYFNSWMGGDVPNADRLLSSLKDVDIGRRGEPRLDRALNFVSPESDRPLMTFERRGIYDRAILGKLFGDLPRGWTDRKNASPSHAHRGYVAMAKRRYFFESRDDETWRRMVPYRSAWDLLDYVEGRRPADLALQEILAALNRGEGLTDPAALGDGLALQVRTVENGTIRNYRIFPRRGFTLALDNRGASARFVEHTPSGLVLRYRDSGIVAELPINLDVFELLNRLNDGYRPTVEELQGYLINLGVFKNVLSSAPYQEILLTVSGTTFYRVRREADERLVMDHIRREVN